LLIPLQNIKLLSGDGWLLELFLFVEILSEICLDLLLLAQDVGVPELGSRLQSYTLLIGGLFELGESEFFVFF
jgi:hypothetical protein